MRYVPAILLLMQKYMNVHKGRELDLVWSRNRIFFYFAKYEITTSDFNFAKFREISSKLFREIVSLCKFFEYQYIRNQF
jgi:hypothetical protein